METMKPKKALIKVLVAVLFLYMLSFTACEEPCWTCVNATGDILEACSESARDIWEAMDFICTQN
jgi:hypothetical protein